ncbi:putative ATPase [Algoriphagus boseongensis]|uniref:Putative ATPase n=1 Tax=Algoriphagus boseongensis TaxID=1442587 RepID=A0A4V3D1X6_9BACT|nr:adenylate/guanylate cyclase domain-containing protein [Algoriphagus boseongensis]TDQ15069.1 putative ATPase [Algoriphagus boseongensis]
MVRLPNSTFKENKNYLFFRDFDVEANCEVIYKIPNEANGSLEELERLKNELDISVSIHSPRIVRAIRIDRAGEKQVLVRTFINGEDLQEKTFEFFKDFSQIIRLSIQIAEALKDLHDSGVFHKDIKPSNIIFNEKTGLATLIDLGIGQKIGEVQKFPEREDLDGTLDFISPEQTGRVNRQVDFRTDFYSAGITLFYLASGKLPYSGEESLSLIHQHIAAEIPFLHIHFPHVPVLYSRIVAKLMAKNPDDRYQSASGLLFDLFKCEELFGIELPPIDEATYKLGQFDVSTELKIPEKLYGREKEIQILERTFDRFHDFVQPLILIQGTSGSGKTALALRLKEIAFRHGSFFLEGKYDHLQKSIPYSAIINALQAHVENLLLEENERVEFWTKRIQKALGRSGKVITDILPNLELLIGQQEEIPVLSGTESQNRFNNVMVKFIRSLGTEDHPTVLLIDDLQWADLGSITILQILLQESSNSEILIVGTYRDNEVHEAHPLTIMLRSLANSGLNPVEIVLGDLELESVIELCQDSFGKDSPGVEELASIIYQKTNGNAFFTRQLLKGLYEEGTISINPKTRHWRWDIQKIIQTESSQNVVDYMTAKLSRLTSEGASVLKYAACLGNSFDRTVLENISSMSLDLFDKGMDEVLINGLLIRMVGLKEKSNNYLFAHDRIQQAAYSGLSEEEKSKIHLKIGRYLLAEQEDEERVEWKFDIVDHLNNGRDSIAEESEKRLLIQMNIQAAEMAKNSAAYDFGLKYAKIGLSLLPSNHWESDYDRALALYNEIAENAFLKTDFVEAHQYIDEILNHVHSLLETETAYKIRVLAYHAQNQLLKSIYSGLEFLEKLGIDLPKNPGKPTIIKSFLEARWVLRNETIESLYHKPLMSDPEKLAAIRMLTYLNGPTYVGLPNMNPILIFEQVKLSVRYGNTPASSSGYGGYGLVLCGLTGEMQLGAKFAQLARDIVEKYDAREEFPKAHLITNVFVRHWTMPLLKSQETTGEIYIKGVEVGDYVFAAYGAEVYCFMQFFAGTPLPQFYEEVETYDHAVLNIIHQRNTALDVSSIRQMMAHLQDPDFRSGSIQGKYYDYEKTFDYQKSTNALNGIFKSSVYQMIMYFLFERYERAAVIARRADFYRDAGIALFHIGAFYFYKALIILALLPKLSGRKKLKAEAELKLCIQKIKWYKKNAPFSYDSKYNLILAEINRIRGNHHAARDFYEKSIQEAKTNGLMHESALACELYAGYLKSLDLMESHRFFLSKAITTYKAYGANSKANFLSEKYQEFAQTHFSPTSNSISSTKGTSLSHFNLNMTTIYKASQVISGEIVLNELLRKMMELLLENAGANKGWFLIKEKGEWWIRASNDLSKKEGNSTDLIELASLPRDQHPLSLKIVQYVERTQKPMVLGDASSLGKFVYNEDVMRLGSKSIFCTPIINQGKILGTIYLVNDLITNAFTEENVELLNLLSSQLSISLQNALLYDSLESQVKERTYDLMKERDLSETLLKNILPSKVAEELKTRGVVEPKHFPKVTVLFTDFKDFTELTKHISPKKLVEELDYVFSKFDEISLKHGIEKIKTIGDSYMAAGGVPLPGINDEIRVIEAALEMTEFLDSVKKQRLEQGSDFYFQARIGIHTGPVVAGVVGKNKFVYDIWGATVNLASRIESSGLPGKVNISGDTYELVKDKFTCAHRGQIDVKSYKQVDMYFVDGRKLT